MPRRKPADYLRRIEKYAGFACRSSWLAWIAADLENILVGAGPDDSIVTADIVTALGMLKVMAPTTWIDRRVELDEMHMQGGAGLDPRPDGRRLAALLRGVPPKGLRGR